MGRSVGERMTYSLAAKILRCASRYATDRWSADQVREAYRTGAKACQKRSIVRDHRKGLLRARRLMKDIAETAMRLDSASIPHLRGSIVAQASAAAMELDEALK